MAFDPTENQYFQEEIKWHEIPPEWRMWLTYLKKVPPTPEQVAASAARRAETLRLAAKIEEEERRERSLRMSRGDDEFPGHAHRDDSAPQDIFRIAASVRRGGGPSPGGGGGGGGGTRVYEEWKPNSEGT